MILNIIYLIRRNINEKEIIIIISNTDNKEVKRLIVAPQIVIQGSEKKV